MTAATITAPAPQPAAAKLCAALHGTPQDLPLAGRVAREAGLETLARALAAGDPAELAALVEPFSPVGPLPPEGSAAERLLAAAFVCRGGFGLEAIRRISGVTAVEDELRDLVERGALAETGGLLTRRWTIPLTALLAARAAAHRLAADEPAIRSAHAAFYLGLARGAHAEFGILCREAHNIDSALTWSCRTVGPVEALATVEALTPYWRHTGGLAIARDRYADLLRAAAHLDPAGAARLRLAAAAVFARLGEPETARALVPAGGSGHPSAMVAYLHGTVCAAEDPDQATARFEEAMAADPDGVGTSAGMDLALVHCARGRLPEARRVAEDLLVRATCAMNDRTAGAALLRLGAIAASAGCAAAAVAYVDRALSRLRLLGPAVLAGELLDLVGSYLIPDVATRQSNVSRLLAVFRAHRRLDPETPWPTDLLARPQDVLAHLTEETVRDAMHGALSATVTAMAAAAFSAPTTPTAPSDHDVLTRRQWEVARCIGDGLTNKQAARRLTISEWTVVNHMREIMRKLDCSSRVQVARWVHQRAT